MDYKDVQAICREQYNRYMEQVSDQKRCPDCKRETTMLKVFVEAEGEDEFAEAIVKWRCMNCLGLFSEKLVKEV